MSCQVIHKDYFHNLPDELQLLIYSFDPTFIQRFRLGLNKVNEQFYKGGFHRKSLRADLYIERQEWCCDKYWRSKHPDMRQDNRLDRRKHPVIEEWNVKKAKAICAVYYQEWSSNYPGIRHLISSGANPVSTWINNIKKFETHHPLLAKTLYL